MSCSERFLRERHPVLEPVGETYLDYGPAIPFRYGAPCVRLLARDPECLYAYWEGGTMLRVVDLTEGGERRIGVDEVGSWFGAAAPEHEYEAEIGRTEAGRFVAAARSNRMRMPRRGPATVVDEAWIPTPAELEELRALAGKLEIPSRLGYGIGSSPKA